MPDEQETDLSRIEWTATPEEVLEMRAEWDASYINDLPDSAFACIDDGGEKEDGKTVPRSLRHYPHHNAAGEVDMPHLRNALSRVAQAGTADCGVAHLHAHAKAMGVGEMAQRAEEDTPPIEEELVVTELPAGELEVRSVEKREIGALIVPWNTVVDTPIGYESFKPGAFAHVDPTKVVLRLEHEGPPIGRGKAIEERAMGAYMLFGVSKTQRGDEGLTLAADGVTPYVSIEYAPSGSKSEVAYKGGRRTTELSKVDLRAVGITHKPYYRQAEILHVRAEGEPEVTEAAPPTDGATTVQEATPDRVAAAIEEMEKRSQAFEKFQATVLERFEKMEERARMDIRIPQPDDDTEKQGPTRGEWAETVIKILTGDRVPDMQLRALADVITSDNAGVVPPTYLTELIGVIDTSRPFLSTTRRLPTPATGMQMIVPVISQRPITGIQSPEKEEVASQKTIIGTESFDAVSIAGAGDISIQVLKRSSRSFLDLWLELLAEAYAIDAEDVAITSLLNAIGGVGGAGALDPENTAFGDAFVASFDAIRRPPDTIWLSTQAVGEFIDAKATTTNSPLYPGLAASATAAGGITGVISGLRPVHVPTLDAHGAFAIVGPSSGFAWAEDGTYTLQVDVPSKAGRDVGLIGMLWPAPWYPAAFTAYNVAS